MLTRRSDTHSLSLSEKSALGKSTHYNSSRSMQLSFSSSHASHSRSIALLLLALLRTEHPLRFRAQLLHLPVVERAKPSRAMVPRIHTFGVRLLRLGGL